MKKRTILLLLSLCLMFVLMPMGAEATESTGSGTCGAEITWELTGDGVLTITGTGPMEDYPHGEYAPWYPLREKFTSVTIGDGITAIGRCAFQGMRHLETISIPDSVVSIGDYAFDDCPDLKSIAIPDGVTSIGVFAFNECEALQEVILPAHLTAIANYAFYGCTSLEGITLPESLESIGGYSFSGCRSLKSLSIPESVTSIGSAAFEKCEKLQNVNIPGSITAIYGDTFKNCRSLESITLPDDLQSIGKYAFSGCWMLDSVVIPDTVKSIGAYAFYDCMILRSVTLPTSITKINGSTFKNTGLTSIVIPKGVTRIGGSAFYSSALHYIDLPDTVTSIGEYAFYNCTGLQTADVPSSVTSIGNYAYRGCTNLKTIYFDGEAPSVGDGVFSMVTADAYYSATDETWTSAVRKNCGGEITWNEIDEPGNGASAVLGDVDGSGSVDFFDGMYVLQYYAGLIDENQINIRAADVDGSGDVSFFDGMYILQRYAGILEAFPFPKEDEAVEIGGSGSCGAEITWELTADGILTINGTGTMEDYADEKDVPWYGSRESITSVSINDGITAIGAYAFKGCTMLSRIVIPNSVTSIGVSAFQGCESLRSVTLPKGITTVEDSTFRHCSRLYTIVIPDSVTSIGRSAFADTGLRHIDFPETLVSIGDYAFDNCDAQVNIYIRQSVTSIGAYAFRGNSRLTTIYFSGASPSIGEGAFSKVKAFAYYPPAYFIWTSDMMKDYGGDLTWYMTGTTPGTPKIEAANVDSSGKIRLTWEAVDYADKYKVYRSTKEDGKYTLLTTTGETSVTNTSAKPGVYYYYYVVAVMEDGTRSSESNTVGCRCNLACPTVSVSNVAETGKVQIRWEEVDGAVKYRVYRSDTKDGDYTTLTTTTETAVTDTSAQAGKTYYYKVKAIAEIAAANSVYSSVKTRACDLPQPEASVQLNAKGKPVITWDAASGSSKYKVSIYDADGELINTSTTSGTSLTHSTAVSGTTYHYDVMALHSNSSANSASSLLVSIQSE